MWACCGPGQLPHMGQFCACSLPCMCLLIAISVPVDCHTGASCLPHRCLVSATCGPHVGQTTATCGPHVGQRCKTRMAHTCALGGSNFNCHMWALCGPLVECLLGRGLWSVIKRYDSMPRRYCVNFSQVQTHARHSRSICAYCCSVTVSVREQNATGCCLPSVICISTPPTP